MEKQTAVEWFFDRLKNHEIQSEHYLLYVKARAMEEEQMRLFYEGFLQNVGTFIKESDLPTFQQYYNETYNK
jgi:hypothetical protein